MKIVRYYSIERKNGTLQISGSQQFCQPSPPGEGAWPGLLRPRLTLTLVSSRSAVLAFLKDTCLEDF